MTCTFTSTA